MKRPPKLCRNKCQNFAYITLKGKQVYLGKWGSAEAQAAYDRFLIDWAKEHKTTDSTAARLKNGGVLLSELVTAYAEEYDARPVRSDADAYAFLQIGKKLSALFPNYLAEDFGVRDLERFRDSWQKDGFTVGGKRREYSRTYLNKIIGRVKTMFAWGVSKEMVSAETANRLKYLQPLRKGQSIAPESSGRHLIPDADYNAVREQISGYYRDILDLLKITGMRPSELCSMRVRDLDKKSVRGAWVYYPEHHKTEYRGESRVIALGKKAKAILTPHLRKRGDDEFVFTPKRAMESKWDERRKGRKTPVQPSQAARDSDSRGNRLKRYGEKLEPNTIAKMVQRACRKAIKEKKLSQPWTPYELRHTAITEVRSKFGAESAQHFAGHSNLNTQKYYDHSALQTAVAIAKKIG